MTRSIVLHLLILQQLHLTTLSYDYGYKPTQQNSVSPANYNNQKQLTYSQIKGGMQMQQQQQYSNTMLASALAGDEQMGVYDPAAQAQLNQLQQSQRQAGMNRLRSQKNGAQKLQAFMNGHDAPMKEVSAAIDWMNKHRATPVPPPPPPAPPQSSIPPPIQSDSGSKSGLTNSGSDQSAPLQSLMPPSIQSDSGLNTESNTESNAGTLTSGGSRAAPLTQVASEYSPANKVIENMENEITPPATALRKKPPANIHTTLQDPTLIKLKADLKKAMAIKVPIIDLAAKR
tara:strand:- start:184 stop:1044 length:861 start_codon:yes stop_codon:yes gene_type:complete